MTSAVPDCSLRVHTSLRDFTSSHLRVPFPAINLSYNRKTRSLAQNAGSTCKRYASYFRPVPRIKDKNKALRAFPPYPNSYPRDPLHKQEGTREQVYRSTNSLLQALSSPSPSYSPPASPSTKTPKFATGSTSPAAESPSPCTPSATNSNLHVPQPQTPTLPLVLRAPILVVPAPMTPPPAKTTAPKPPSGDGERGRKSWKGEG